MSESMRVACLCHLHLLPRTDEAQRLQVMSQIRALMDSPDWRVREYLRRSLNVEYAGGEGTVAGRFLTEMQQRLAEDPDPRVRAALTPDERKAAGGLRFAPPATPASEAAVVAAVEAGSCAQLTFPDRQRVARGEFGAIPVDLLTDPVCRVRFPAAERIDLSEWPDIWSALCRDPCLLVKSAAVKTWGAPADVVDELDEHRLFLAALGGRDPQVLARLAEIGDTAVRIQVARNSNCPMATLLELAGDQDDGVAVSAYGNLHWPSCLPVHPNVQIPASPREASELGGVVGTRTPVGCMAGRGMVWRGVPRCGDDAVLIHTWGAVCMAHSVLLEAGGPPRDGAGYWARRMSTGVWAPTDVRGPVDELWSGREFRPGMTWPEG